MGKWEIIKQILSNIDEIKDLSFDLGDTFNQDTMNMAEWLGISISHPFQAFLINLVGLFLIYKLSIRMTDDVLLKVIKGVIALIFILMAASLFQ